MTDYYERLLKCKGCGKTISGRAEVAADGVWHAPCFVASESAGPMVYRVERVETSRSVLTVSASDVASSGEAADYARGLSAECFVDLDEGEVQFTVTRVRRKE